MSSFTVDHPDVVAALRDRFGLSGFWSRQAEAIAAVLADRDVLLTMPTGAGKSLVAVGKIRDKLNAGCPVATNLDIRVHNMISRKAKKTKLYRIPDKPTSEDLSALGVGNTGYDDTKNGLIVLDECATWFNARSWQDKDRQKVLDWLVHARKLGWDIIFLIQDVSMIFQ